MAPEMKAARMHYEALMRELESLGIGMEAFLEQMEEAKGMESPEMEEEGEGSEEEKAPGPMHGERGKLAIIVARMKNRMKE